MTEDDAPGRRDIDVRFLLANERTLLAWLRTALALMAGGVALAQLAHDRPPCKPSASAC
ncbi:YidH family protein [Luedemannella flava]